MIMADNLMADFKSFYGNGTSAIALDGGFQEFLHYLKTQKISRSYPATKLEAS